ncbi:hypothetical protein GPECTOR_41g670 [Gonium pectorale]|uniref:Uncharacterized protein n=1 Tax=Gonium pectorale TaxID=33097 RepID=A0A150GA31_GONPE|nr:hypothetical protein GPECTOR_41g670 [Gonium pectorale]|eukprot:KXZ46706.1 hypothetical protein GPECTOR_41g670 [Gonium pectorale]
MDTDPRPDTAQTDACDKLDNSNNVEDAEEMPGLQMHPLAVALRHVDVLQHQLFLAGQPNAIQTHSRDNTEAGDEDAGPYARLACDMLSTTVSACEVWRDGLLRLNGSSALNTQLSTMELCRLLEKLLASLHVLDCMKDSKLAMRAALMSVPAKEGEEQQLLAAVQEHLAQLAAIAEANNASTIPSVDKAAAVAAHKLLRCCVAGLRVYPIVPGYGDMPIDVLRPLQGLPQLTSSTPWDSPAVLSGSAGEERYGLSATAAAAALDYGRVTEELLALKLQHEATKTESQALDAGVHS